MGVLRYISHIAHRKDMLLVIFFIILTTMMLRNAFYTHPMADDYCWSNLAFSSGNWFDAVLELYRTWGGRYSAWALVSLFALEFNLVSDYWIVIVGLIVFLLLSFYVFFSSLSYIAGSRSDWLLWAIFSFCFYVAVNPALSEVLFWWAGGVHYTLGYGSLLITIGFLVRLSFIPLSRVKKYFSLAICGILIFITAGLTEIVALLQSVIVGTGMLLAFSRRSSMKYSWVYLFIVSLVSLVIVVTAPGNFTRAEYFSGGSIWVAPFYSLYQSAGVIAGTIIIMLLVTANVAVFPLLQRLSSQISESLAVLSQSEKVLLVLGIVALYCAVYMPGYIATAGAPPKRVQAILYIIPLLIWIPCIGLLMTYKKIWNPMELWLGKNKVKINYISAILLVAILAFMNINNIFIDTLWRAQSYDSQLTQRYADIKNEKLEGNTDLEVVAIEDVPKSMFFGDILTISYNFRNQCYKDYFGLNSIKTIKK